MRNRIKKALFILVALALVSGLGFSGQANGCAPQFYISITSITGGGETEPPYTNPICLSGTASVTYFPGQLRQYQVQVDWGDGSVDENSTVNFIKSGDGFSGTWSSDPCHRYSACGTYTIIAIIYHQNSPGAESGETKATIRVCASYDLTVYSTPGGSVINPGEGTFAYDGGSPVNIVAQPDPCYQFVNWTGDVDTVDNVTAAATTITMNGDYSITANFEAYPLPTCHITATPSATICAGGSVTLTEDSGNATSWLWTTQETTKSIVVSASGTYGVTLTDANGCTSYCEIEVTVNPLPEATASNDGPVCEGGSIMLSGGTDDLASYRWTGPNGYSSNQPSPVLTNVGVSDAGTYTLTVTTLNGCTDSASTNVTIKLLPTCHITATPSATICAGGSVMLTEDGGNATSWLWTTQETTKSIVVSASGTYGVTITDANGCTSYCEIEVTVNPLPVCTPFSWDPELPNHIPPNFSGNVSVPDAREGAFYGWSIDGGTVNSIEPYGRTIN